MSDTKETRALRAVIRRSLSRELTKMQDDAIYGINEPKRINDWVGDSLASWIAPGVIASVERHLRNRNLKPRKPRP